MLFNSYSFIFLFFPLTLCLHRLLRPVGALAQQTLLLLASWLLYAWWDVRFLPLLLLSIATNFLCGYAIAYGIRRGRPRGADLFLAIGIACNVLAIGVFKYAEFFLDNVDALLGTDFVIRMIILPLGISFFTFEQIAFLVDVRRGQATPADPLRYALFVSFFPRLVAGPILRYNEIVPQLTDDRRGGPRGEDVMVGMTIFFIGVIKKVVLADGVAVYASPVFSAAQVGEEIDFFLAWCGALAYTCSCFSTSRRIRIWRSGCAMLFAFGCRSISFRRTKHEHHRILATLAHHAVAIFARLRVLRTGGKRHGSTRRHVNLFSRCYSAGSGTAPIGRSSSGAACTAPIWRSITCGTVFEAARPGSLFSSRRRVPPGKLLAYVCRRRRGMGVLQVAGFGDCRQDSVTRCAGSTARIFRRASPSRCNRFRVTIWRSALRILRFGSQLVGTYLWLAGLLPSSFSRRTRRKSWFATNLCSKCRAVTCRTLSGKLGSGRRD